MREAKALVPKLRFPEFRDVEGWSLRPLGEMLMPIVREREKPTAPYTGLGIRSHGKGTFRKELQQPEKTSMERLYEVDSYDLIVNITFAWEGAIAIVRPEDTGALVSHRFPTYQFDQNAALPEFFRNLILDQQFIYNLGVISPGGAGRNRVLNKSDFLKIKLAVPEIDEQQKIADCLDSLDNLIAAEGRKLEALRQHKQGLMQQLFPRPGETVPQLRFPEFQDWPEWDSMPLSCACDINPRNNGLPERFIYVDLESVKNGTLIKRKAIKRDAAPSRAQRLLIRKDIIYQTVRPYQRNNLIFDINDVNEYVASTGYAQLRARECPEFLHQLLYTDSFVNNVLARCAGSNYPAIKSSDLASICVALPRKTEQQKIADCLDSLDDLIEAKSRALEALQQHKQALMQQLFPSLEDQ